MYNGANLDDLTDAIIGAAIEVHRHLGPGLLESIYQAALCHELTLRSIPFEQQASRVVMYKGHAIKGQRIDLLVAQEVVVEIKSLSRTPEAAMAQTLSYLRSLSLRRALLINFGRSRMVDGITRISL